MKMHVLAALLVSVTAVTAAQQPAPAPLPSDVLFNPDVVQRIDLRLHSADWEKLKQNFQENTYYPADLVYNGTTVLNTGIRSRGLGSRSATKPGLRVDFDRYSADLTFLGLKSLVLDNLTQDPSAVRETVTMKLFARLGIPAPREAHVRLYINDHYAGLYAVVESIDKSFLARVFGSIGDDTQNDGHLFEFDYLDPWTFGYLGPGARELQDPVRSEDPREQERRGTLWTDRKPREAGQRTGAGAVPVGSRRAPRSQCVHALHRSTEFRRPERRVPRLRRHEQLLFLSSRELGASRLSGMGRGQRVLRSRFSDQHAARRKHPDAQGDAGAGAQCRVQQSAR